MHPRAERPIDLARSRRHDHSAGASRSFLGLEGQPEARLRNPCALEAASTPGKQSSLRLGHNRDRRPQAAPEARP